jgi:hypothetical protein
MNSIETTREVWKNIAKRLNGELIFSETEKANFNYGIITAKINYDINDSNVELHQGIFEGGGGNLRYNLIEISTKLPEQNLTLNLWRLGFLERLFNRCIMKTSKTDLDKTFGFESSDKELVYYIFNILEIRKEFMHNRNLILNTIDGQTGRIIRMKNLITPYDAKEIEKFIALFNKIILLLQKRKH